MWHDIAIETDRFLLREFREADRAAFLGCQRDAAVARFHTEVERADEHAGQVFDLILRWRKERPRRNVQLAVTARTSPADYLGTVGIRAGGLAHGVGEIGVELVPLLWGRGAAGEVLGVLVSWARTEMGITVLVAETAPGNRAAERLAETMGLRLIGGNEKRRWRSGG